MTLDTIQPSDRALPDQQCDGLQRAVGNATPVPRATSSAATSTQTRTNEWHGSYNLLEILEQFSADARAFAHEQRNAKQYAQKRHDPTCRQVHAHHALTRATPIHNQTVHT
jgi:hypothetical protein